MAAAPIPHATALSDAVDLSAAWNASDHDVARTFHPRYAQALGRAPEGASVFRGLPFALGWRGAGQRWILVDGPTVVHVDGTPGASHLVVAHFSDSWRDQQGERLAGIPVGWVLPTGEPLAEYRLRFVDGTEQAVTVRRRFEIADGIIGWGFLPFEAVGHRADEPVDWRGPHPRLGPARYAPAGHAGPLTMLPGGWGPAQSGVADFVPTLEDDVTCWLHAIPLASTAPLVEVRLIPLGNGRPGAAVVVAGMTVFSGSANPLVLAPRRQVLVRGLGDRVPEVDLGVVIRVAPLLTHRPSVTTGQGSPAGWGRSAATPGADSPFVIDVALAPDGRLRVGDCDVAAADLSHGEVAGADGWVTITPLAQPRIRVDIRVTAEGEPVPSRVRFVAADGRYLPPLGHREEINPGLVEDMGADILLGDDAYAYVPGDFQVDLPLGEVTVEVVKGFDHAVVHRTFDVQPGSRDMAIPLDRVIDLRDAGWRSSDSHVHFLSPTTALLQAAAEDVTFVHLLATQWGDHFTNTQDLAWGSQRDPSGRHAVILGTENRQNMLGHLALLGARRPVVPMASGGAPEGRLAGAVTELLADWADRCRADGGVVVGAHFPLPLAEIAADIATGRIDAVEMQVFAPGLDNPSILEWYRFLNCGFRLPVLGGTDKMSAEVPVGAVRTYARLDPRTEPTFDAWATAVRAGRTFATSGPVVELSIDGHEPGDVIALPHSGGRLEARVHARAAQPVIGCVELVLNGQVIARRDAPEPTTDLALATTVEVTAGAWVAARSRSDSEILSAFRTSMAAHTSPVYVEVADRPLFVPDDAAAILQVIDGTARWLATMAAIPEPDLRAAMVARVATSGDALRERVRQAGRQPA